MVRQQCRLPSQAHLQLVPEDHTAEEIGGVTASAETSVPGLKVQVPVVVLVWAAAYRLQVHLLWEACLAAALQEVLAEEDDHEVLEVVEPPEQQDEAPQEVQLAAATAPHPTLTMGMTTRCALLALLGAAPAVRLEAGLQLP